MGIYGSVLSREPDYEEKQTNDEGLMHDFHQVRWP